MYDLTRGTKTKIFDMYYDKFKHGLKDIQYGKGTISPKLWGHRAKQASKKVMEGRPHVVDSILNNEIDLVINTTEGTQSIKDSASIRQSALRNKIFCTTTMFGAFAIIDALQNNEDDWTYSKRKP